METKDHLLLARTLAAGLQLSFGRRMAFILGNLVPDINPISYLSPSCQSKLNGHCYEHRRGSIERSLSKKGCRSCLDWYRAGNTTHYLADSFTRPHNETFAFGYWEHITYEHDLHRVFYRQISKRLSSKGRCPGSGRLGDVDAQWLGAVDGQRLGAVDGQRTGDADRAASVDEQRLGDVDRGASVDEQRLGVVDAQWLGAVDEQRL